MCSNRLHLGIPSNRYPTTAGLCRYRVFCQRELSVLVGCFKHGEFISFTRRFNLTIFSHLKSPWLSSLVSLAIIYEKLNKMLHKTSLKRTLYNLSRHVFYTVRLHRYFQANRLSFGILICGIIFQMIPSSLVFLCTLAGFAIFKSLGPFYILGLTACGVANSFIYIGLHAEIKSAAKYAVGIKKGSLSNAGASIMPTTTARTQITRMTNVVNTERAANRMVNNFANK